MNESKPEWIMDVQEVNRVFPMPHEQVRALDRVSLQVLPGERLCITGPSGAGKSTLLNIMGGLDHPTGGRVFFRNTNLYACRTGARARIRAAHFGFVFQAYFLIPELSVLENVLLPAMNTEVRRGSLRAARERAMELIQSVGLDARTQHRPRELSGGEQQRVALARALMNDPELILADEPTGNLDSRTGGRILEILLQLSEDAGRTLVIVTHSAEVAAFCTREFKLDLPER